MAVDFTEYKKLFVPIALKSEWHPVPITAKRAEQGLCAWTCVHAGRYGQAARSCARWPI